MTKRDSEKQMKSVIDKEISIDTVAMMTNRAFDEEPSDIELINQNFYFTTFRVALPYGSFVLRIAPPDKVLNLRTEKHMTRTEFIALKKISEFKYVPVSHIVYYDDSRKILNREYFFANTLQGVPLSKVYERLSDAQISDLSTQIGIYAFKIHSITGEFFGSLADSKRMYRSWGKAFYAMVDDALCDAENLNLKLPFEPQALRQCVKDERELLDEIKVASLVHNRLNFDNILVDFENVDVTGIINFKRAVFGDALLEPVCSGLCDDENFVCSYNSGRAFNERQRLRISLYRIYSGLLYQLELCRVPDFHKEMIAKEQIIKGISEYCQYKNI